jgi:hypothetical protein
MQSRRPRLSREAGTRTSANKGCHLHGGGARVPPGGLFSRADLILMSALRRAAASSRPGRGCPGAQAAGAGSDCGSPRWAAGGPRPRSPERLIRRLGDHDTAEVLADSGQCRGAALGQAGDYRVLCVLSAVVMTSAPEPEITTPTWRAHGSWSEQRCRTAGVVCLGRTSAPEGVVSPRCCLPLAARIRRPVIHAQPLPNAHGCCQPAPERCPQPVEACWATWVPVPRMIMWRQPRGSLAICPVFDDDCRLRRGQGAARPVPSPCAGHGGAPARDRS